MPPTLRCSHRLLICHRPCPPPTVANARHTAPSAPFTRPRRRSRAASARVGRQGPASAPGVWPPSFFPLPGSVIDAPPGRLGSEHIIGIYVPRECLPRRALHRHVALRSYISLIRDVERRELRNTVVDRQSRCNREIGAPRSRGALVLRETTNVGSIVVSRRRRRGPRRRTRGRGSRRRHHCSRCGWGRGTWRRRRCGWGRRGWLWRACSDRENAGRQQIRALNYRESSRHVVILLLFSF